MRVLRYCFKCGLWFCYCALWSVVIVDCVII